MGTGTLKNFVAPKVDIFETNDAFTIEAELPGVAVDDVVVEIKEGKLYLTGTRRVRDGSGKTHRSERVQENFYRAFELGQDVDASRVEARITNGVLTLSLGKANHARSHCVSVN